MSVFLVKARGHGTKRPAVESEETSWLGAKTGGSLSDLDSRVSSLELLPPH